MRVRVLLRGVVGGCVEHGDRPQELIAIVRANLGLVRGGESDKWAVRLSSALSENNTKGEKMTA